jgi:hypothetical protein
MKKFQLTIGKSAVMVLGVKRNLNLRLANALLLLRSVAVGF